jgi:hypothetical protein
MSHTYNDVNSVEKRLDQQQMFLGFLILQQLVGAQLAEDLVVAPLLVRLLSTVNKVAMGDGAAGQYLDTLAPTPLGIQENPVITNQAIVGYARLSLLSFRFFIAYVQRENVVLAYLPGLTLS